LARNPQPSNEGGTSFGQLVFLVLLVPVTVGMLTGPLVGAGLASLALLSTTLLVFGFDQP
jgi:hypothetical protein